MERLNEKVTAVEAVIHKYMPKPEGYAKTVLAAMNYTMDAGGKRLRPLLMQEVYKMFGGNGEEIEPFMAAIEMIHTYSLVHDDLPALDNDDYRRGRKTAHIVYGESMAILAGDALLNYAYETAAKAFDLTEDLKKATEAYKVLTRKPGIYGMVGGQTADVELTGKALTNDELEYIYENKTGALIEASMMIGAIMGGAADAEVAKIERLAGLVGKAFQIQDDILDVELSSEEFGKSNSDEKNDKKTSVSLLGLEQSKELMISEYEKVKQSISEMHDFNGEKLISFIESIEKRRK